MDVYVFLAWPRVEARAPNESNGGRTARGSPSHQYLAERGTHSERAKLYEPHLALSVIINNMKRTILITAVAGSGKSTVCRALIKLGYEAYDIESIPGLFSLIDPHTDKVLEGKQLGDLNENLDADWVCDTEKLKLLIANQKNEVAFYCGGTSRTEELMAFFDSTVILQVSDETTRNRLSTRQSGEFGDSEQTREWVLSWKHRVEADWLAAGAVSVSGEPEPRAVAKDIVNKICISETWTNPQKDK